MDQLKLKTRSARQLDRRKSEQMMSHRYYTSVSDHLYRVFAYGLCWVAVLVVVLPMIFVLAASFSSPQALLSAKVFFWPVDFTLRGYKMVFEHKILLQSIFNSISYTVVGTIVNVTMTVLAAYPLSRKDLRLRGGLMLVFAFTMLFSGGMIPTYLLVRDLKLLDTFWVMILPGALSIWNLIITRTYFQITIPGDLLDSASIDGCDDFRFLAKIAIPLSAPIIAVNALLYAVGHWNSYFNAMMYLTTNTKFPLQLILRAILIQSDMGMTIDAKELLERQETKYLLQFSTIVVGSIPVMLLYPFVQRYFIKGIMVGAIKG